MTTASITSISPPIVIKSSTPTPTTTTTPTMPLTLNVPPSSTPTTISNSMLTTSETSSPSPTPSYGSSDGNNTTGNRSRRGRPPSMPEDMLRNIASRVDKTHHKCPHCPQIYYGYHAMRDHITSVHLNAGNKYICHLCNKEYTWRITLRKHLKFHHHVHPDEV